MRILVTGSRDWPWPDSLAVNLMSAAAGTDDDEITLVSGACPTGADAQAEHVAERMGWTIERHPADWTTHGKRAGYLRNAAMVAAGADLCVAFIKDDSRGAAMTLQLAQRAGIPCQVHRATTSEEWEPQGDPARSVRYW
jgi:hypothetical protein